MTKYIDADKAVEALLELYDHVGFFEKDTVAESIGVIKGMPAADVVEIKKDPCEDCQEFDCQECKYRERGRLYGR